MIITKVTLENFGLYAGKQEFDLKPDRKKNIILIGGKNGNGKTTLFEAIRFCLYGPAMFERRLTSKEYEMYLRGRIHHNPRQKSLVQAAKIRIEFEHVNLGRVETYTVERAWEDLGSKLSESFTVLRDGNPLGEVESDQWQNFINDLIPLGLSELFFFDGEKIQNLANDDVADEQLADSFKSLLGVDVVEKLQSDLEIYLLRQMKQSGTKELQDKIETLEGQKLEDAHILDDLLQEEAQIASKIANILANIERQEGLVNKEGGSFAGKREMLKAKRITLDADLSATEEQLRAFCGQVLPFVFAPKLSAQVRDSLTKEDIARTEQIAQRAIEKRLGKLKRDLADPGVWQGMDFKKADAVAISKRIEEALTAAGTPKAEARALVHNLSTEDQTRLLQLIDQAATSGPQQLTALIKRYESLTRARQQVERELNFAAPDAAISGYLAELNRLHQELGILKQKQAFKEEELATVRQRLEKTDRELKKISEARDAVGDAAKRLRLVQGVQSVLGEYYEVLKNSKVQSFSKTFLESYDHIARKKGVFSKVVLDPATYKVTLYKAGPQGEREVPKSELSAGEKQIYAITVLWTLTKMSHRQLPFIIDTPLGRLDRDHRDNLALNFFPQASKQLIILSTDTEIDKEYFKSLNPYLAKVLKLEYHDGQTAVRQGYFWS